MSKINIKCDNIKLLSDATVLESLISLFSDSKFNDLFITWYTDKSESNFKNLKGYSKRNIRELGYSNIKMFIKDYAGVQLPVIKIIDDNIKFVCRIGYHFDIHIKEFTGGEL